MLLLLALCAAAFGHQPTCATLFCDSTQVADAWIAGALDEMAILQQTLFGGFLPSGRPHDGCFEKAPLLDCIACFDPDHDLPSESCYAADCNFRATPELFRAGARDCCDADPTSTSESSISSSGSHDSVCRTLRRWAAIGVEKLYEALDATNAANATAAACAAERVLAFVNRRLHSKFLDLHVQYRHEIGEPASVEFVAEQGSVDVRTRTIETFRGQAGGPYALVMTYMLSVVLQRLGDDVQQQLIWPAGGTVPPFDVTGLPSTNECARAADPSTITPLFSETRRLSTLGTLDYAVVVDTYLRCDGFPRAGAVRRYGDLRAAAAGSAPVLMVDVDAGAASGAHSVSFVYVAHRSSAILFESGPIPDISATLFLRIADPLSCTDYPSTPLVQAAAASAQAFRATAVGLPVTLAPGESRCVGGTRAGAPCSGQSECGAGTACRANLDGSALCYDGTWWDEARPCDVARDECPYGACYGAANGHDGGAFPGLHAWREAGCADGDASCAGLRDWRSSARIASK